jgi:hypothetical protein
VKEAAVLAFSFPGGSSGTLHIARLAFSSVKGERPGEVSIPAPAARRPMRHAMWFWEFGDCLTDTTLCDKVFAFARQNAIDTIFAQVPADLLSHVPRLRDVIAAATAAGLRIHALDGAPEYALEPNHPKAIALARAVLEYNRSSPVESRFAGLHFDIEPYLLLGFDSAIRPEILREYLALHREVAKLVRGELEFGADIPFWYDESAPYVLEFEGRTQDVARHLIDMLDNVVLMDYRNTPIGADGIIAHAAGEVGYSAGRSQVLIGVETQPQKAETVVFVAGMTEQQWREQRSNPLMRVRRFGGYGLRTFGDGVNRYLGLAAGGSDGLSMRSALEALAQAFNVSKIPGTAKDEALAKARTAAMEYSSFTPFELQERAAFMVSTVPLARLSFAGKTQNEMFRVLNGVEEYYGASPGFGGTAIHSYASWILMPR